MATCKKCDKCGVTYDDKISVRYSARKIYSIKVEEVNGFGENFEKHIDLCPKCAEEFSLFMKEYKTYEENDTKYTPLDVFLAAYEQTKFINKCLIKIASGEQIENNELHILSTMSSGNAIYDKIDNGGKNNAD